MDADAVLFDLDGVLVDSEPVVERVWGNWARGHGLDPDVVVGQIHGRRMVDSIRALAPGLDAGAEAERLNRVEVEDMDGLGAYDGVATLLEALPAGAWAVVTSCTHELAHARLGASGLPVPEVLVGAEDVARGKPDPEGYLLGAARLGVPADRTVVVEDAPAGVAAGKAAGMTVLAVVTTHAAEELDEADARFSSHRELAEELRRRLG